MAVYDHIWTAEDPSVGSAAPIDDPHRESYHLPEGDTSIHVAVYTLYLSGLKQRYRHFLRQPDGAITEVGVYNMYNISTYMTATFLREIL